jgi:DNA end-binding protein Ku
MSVLYLEDQLKNPDDLAGDIGQSTISHQELKLATSLIDATTLKLDFSKYKDKYTERVQELLDAKLAGRKIEPHVAGRIEPAIDIVAALRKSLKKAGGAAKPRRSASRKHAPRRRAS